MDKISEILNDLKKRLSSPFFFSLIISWLIYNWPITVALIWFDPEQIKRAGYVSIFDLISCNAEESGTFLWPFVLALLYTFVHPFFTSLISATKAKANTLANKWIVGITKDSSIPTRKFLKLKAEYDKNTKSLEDTIANEEKTLELLETEKSNRLASETSNAELRNTITMMTNSHNDQIEILKRQIDEAKAEFGVFRNRLTDRGYFAGGLIIQYHKQLKRDSIYYVKNNTMISQDGGVSFQIGNFYRDHISGTITFVKVLIKDSDISSAGVPVDYKIQRDFGVLPDGHPLFTIVNLQEQDNGLLPGREDFADEVTYILESENKQVFDELKTRNKWDHLNS